MKIISFAWTTEALVMGKKTVTRRSWNNKYARAFRKGDLLQAWDRSPRYGGKCVAIIRLTCDPYKEALSAMPDTEEKAEGGVWGSAKDFIEAYCAGNQCGPDKQVWVLRFELIELKG